MASFGKRRPARTDYSFRRASKARIACERRATPGSRCMLDLTGLPRVLFRQTSAEKINGFRWGRPVLVQQGGIHGSSFIHPQGRRHRRRRRRRDGACRARHRPVEPEGHLAADVVLPEIARHDLWRRRSLLQDAVGSDRRQFHRSRSSPPAKSCPACRRPTPPRPARSRPATRWPIITGARTRPGRSARRCRSRSTRAA